MNKIIKVKCPNCEKIFSYNDSKFRPFCTERCQLIDLGQWLNGSYTVASKEALDEEDLEIVIKENFKNNDNE